MAKLQDKASAHDLPKTAGAAQETPHQGIILVVDDSRMQLIHLVSHLKKAGYQVFDATDGLQALSVAKQYKPDIILSDYFMPKMNGLELAEAIKSDSELSDIYFILLTGDENQEERNHTHNGIVDAVIQKPISGKDAVARINSVMKLKRLRAEMESLDT